MLRPSGVSSGSEASRARSASSSAATPAAGRNSTAWRFPSVIVPVLSSSRVFTSPAASTARPLIAMTLRWISRSIPAMPMAESSPPMVVGIRQTSSAIRTGTRSSTPLYAANGRSMVTVHRNTMVSPESRIVRATSLGVLRRLAPSTRAIIRSTNVSPGLAVTRTTSQSETRRVPPVTAERSAPASRITGADSPVMAASSTDAMPSITSPSAGIRSPDFTMTWSPRRSSVANTDTKSRWSVGSRSRFARVSSRVPRSASACALPRPSAIASAKLANKTVNQSQTASCTVKPTPGMPRIRSRTQASVVRTLPVSTTNMTGFRSMCRGFSL